ncbi:MAG: hypothetical protein AAF928_05775 [Myxococcota bacterium]
MSEDEKPESPSASSEASGPRRADGPADEATAPPAEDAPPAETFKQGLGLLWKAAVAATDEIKREVERGQVTETLQQAGKELESAAQQAAQAFEGFIGRVAPSGKPPASGDPFPSGKPSGEPSGGPSRGTSGKPRDAASRGGGDDADEPHPSSPATADERGVDAEGNCRDMRIQLEDEG